MAEYRDSLDYGTRRQYDAYWTPERLAAARVIRDRENTAWSAYCAGTGPNPYLADRWK